MVTASPKLRLASLPASEISGLVQAVPGLARIWAREAGTDADWLERGRPRALNTLRVAMTRHNDLFVAALAHAGMHQIAHAHDTPEFEVDAADRPRELALAAGAAFGPVAGLFLAAVAASDDPLADEVAARLEELRLLAAGSGSQPEEPEPSEGDDSAPEPAVARPGEWRAAEAMLGRTRDLLSLGSELAASLREAAVGVESGRPVTELADRLRDWSEAVRAELADAAAVTAAEDLTALSESLENIIRRAQAQAQVNAQEQRRRDALRGAEALQAEGLDHLIPGMLQAAGFGSLEELMAGSLSGTGAERGQAHEKASCQDAPDDEPRGDAETLPGLSAAANEQPVDMDPAPWTPDAAAPITDGAEGPEPGAGESPHPAELAEAPAGPPAAPAGTRADGQPDGTAHLEPTGATADRQDADLDDKASEPAEHLFPVVPEPAGDAALPAAVTQQSASTAEGALLPPGDEKITFPWDLGTPPLLASLISQERDALAVCVSEAAQETAARQRLLRFFCAAYGCTPAGLELQLPDLIPPEDEVATMGTDECRVLLAAALRAGLSLGYSPVGLAPLIDRADLGAGTRELIDAATEAVQHGYHRRGPSTTTEQADLLRQWTAFTEEAQVLRESLGRRKIAFQRATNVLHHMVRLEEPVGHALGLVTELAARGVGAATADGDPEKESWSHIEKVASDLSSPGKRAKLITQADRAVSTAVQLRKPIIAGAKTRLEDSLLEAVGLLNRFCAARSEIRLSSQAEDLRLADDLFRAITPELASGEIASVGDATLQRLAAWLHSGTPTLHAVSIHELVQAELEPLYEIPRDGDGNATRPGTLTEVSELVRGRETEAVMRGYLAIGNVAAARASIAKGGQADSSALDDEVLRGAKAARQRQEDALAAVERTAARLRAVYDDEAARNLTLQAEPFRVVPDDRFDLTIEPLRVLADEGDRHLSAFRDELRRRTESAGCTEKDKQRILELIDQQDEILAVEFLTLAESGRGLPSVSHQHGDDFSDFFPEMVNVAIAASRNGTDATEAVRSAAAAAGDPANRQLAAGLDAWRELQTRKRGSDRFQSCVADVLRMLGLVPRAQTWLQEHSRTQRAGYATFRVRATPVDRSYVPSLGTQAHDAYDLTLAWDPVTPARLLDFIDERRRNEANIILYFGTLTPEQRLQLRRLTSHETGKGFSPLIVDEPVIGWLSARPEPGWRFTQRVTLPFTTLNPYTPFAGGDVPDEVFVGRESEREAIESATGSMFVYGGRQLGKSALLRRVERLFTEPITQSESGSEAPRTGRLAVYLDLKAAAIGEAQEPAALWAVLAQRLADTQILPKRRRGLGADEVTDQLATWLAADGTNRLLLLLDEADNFLTADFRAGRPGGGAEFPTLQRLKGLMELSGRRFKPIFAGLHQVQRFHDSSNTPVAHGGDDILVGPLRSMDAHRLVVDPMRVLGYEFAAPELVWRLLLFTNYQASLIQIVCEALVRQLQSRPLPAEGGRIVITSTDVESVYAKREVRDLIVQRFRWTINVDSRYRVIALVVAFRSFDVEPGETFTISELHDECEYFWPTGFSRDVLSSKEFQRYLEEMVGLGVLHRRDEQYGLRSPTIVGLLGTRQSLEDELAEVAKHLELPYEYNPTMNRRILGQSAELGAPRSPLTDHDIATLLTQGSDTGGTVRIVTGSSALTVDRAAQVIRDVAEERQVAYEVVKPEGAEAAVAAARGAQHIIVDASSEPVADLPALIQVLTRRPNVSGTVIVGPQHLPLPQDIAAMCPAITLRRWSIEGLRSWYESPFAAPELRKRLHRVTSGWPLLVERTMQEISHGKSPEAALTKITELLGDPAFAREQILSCGIEVDLAVRWALWQSRTGPDGLPEATPANLADLSEALQADAGAVIDRLQDLDLVESAETGWVLDRVVLAAAVALQE